MLNCKEVALLIASDELADAVWSDRARIRVRLHLLMCRHCRRYAAQLVAIGAGVRDRWDPGAADTQTLESLTTSILERSLGASDENPKDTRGRDAEPPAI